MNYFVQSNDTAKVNVILSLNFTNPSLISSSNEPDIIKVTVKQRIQFRNKIMVITLLEGENQ